MLWSLNDNLILKLLFIIYFVTVSIFLCFSLIELAVYFLISFDFPLLFIIFVTLWRPSSLPCLRLNINNVDIRSFVTLVSITQIFAFRLC